MWGAPASDTLGQAFQYDTVAMQDLTPRVERLIVHMDDDLAVIEKPAGLVVHTAPSHRGETLVDLLAGITGGGEGERPGIVHRLDKDTSGLMLVARNDRTHKALSAAVKRREVVREYTALVEGRLESRSGTIDAPLGRHRRRRTRMAVRGTGSRQARTHFEVIEALPADTLARARLETGRTHQIRVHFAAIDHPVAGDPEYGTRGRHGLERQFLHASRLEFIHPGTEERLSFTSALPEDLQAALERARKTG
jgi:23S rRNA pseudouridine1911/1915/1917 synthase